MNKILDIVLVLILLIVMSNAVNSSLICDNTKVTFGTNKVSCLYKPLDEGLIYITQIPNNYIDFKLDKYTIESQGGSYTIDFYINYNNSKKGQNRVELMFNDRLESVIFDLVDMKNDISYNTKYEEGQIIVNLVLKNNFNNNIDTLISVIETPKGVFIDNKNYRFISKSNQENIFEIRFNYTNIENGIIKLRISEKGQITNIDVPIESHKAPYNENISPLFTLNFSPSKTTLIITNIILFLIAVGLFSAFISRLGKKIVKERF